MPPQLMRGPPILVPALFRKRPSEMRGTIEGRAPSVSCGFLLFSSSMDIAHRNGCGPNRSPYEALAAAPRPSDILRSSLQSSPLSFLSPFSNVLAGRAGPHQLSFIARLNVATRGSTRYDTSVLSPVVMKTSAGCPGQSVPGRTPAAARRRSLAGPGNRPRPSVRSRAGPPRHEALRREQAGSGAGRELRSSALQPARFAPGRYPAV